MVVAVDILMAVDRHEQLAIERAEQHAVSEVGWGNGLFFLHPRAVQCAAFRISYPLGIDIINPTGPYHTQASCLGAEQIRAVRHAVGKRVSFDDFPAPRRCAGLEQ